MIAFVATPLGHATGWAGEAVGLLFVSLAAGFGFAAFALLESQNERPHGLRLAQGAAVAAGVSVVLAYAFPFVIIRGPGGLRPSSTARLEILSPHPGQIFQGEPASVPVRVRLVGGTLTTISSSRPTPDVGHVHVYLDGNLVSMAQPMSGRVDVPPGEHEVRAEFVASDHGPFNPPVRASVAFHVGP